MTLSASRQAAHCQADRRVVASLLISTCLVWSGRTQHSSWSEVAEEDRGSREWVKDRRKRRGKKRTYVKEKKEQIRKRAEL